jgi:hypothetical protein
MSFGSAAAAAGRSGGAGPMNALLSSPAAQWATLGGLGAYIVSPEKVSATLQHLVNIASATSPLDHHHLSNSNDRHNTVPSSIVIHTGSSSLDGSGGSGNGNKNGIVTTMVTYTLVAGCVWVTYTVLSHALPEYIGNLLPVTRRVFDQTSQRLAVSLHKVKDVLGSQILAVMKKQDVLSDKQDDMHRDVQGLQDDVSCVRTDLLSVLESVDRCEATVQSSLALQSYTARGVKLLVSAVSMVLPASDNHGLVRELEQYAREGQVFRGQLEQKSTAPPQPQPQHSLTALTAVNEPPENDHPRRYIPNPLSSYPPQEHSTYSDKYPPTTTTPHPTVTPHHHHYASRPMPPQHQYSGAQDFYSMMREGPPLAVPQN